MPSPLYTFPLLFAAFLMTVAGSYLLARSGLEGVFSAELFNTPRGALVLAIVPFSLVAFASLLLFGVVSDSLRRRAANRTGVRLFFAFALVIACATVPQTLIMGKFVGAALGSWFDARVTESLDDSVAVAELYANERARTVALVASRRFTALAIADWRKRPVDWMVAAREADSGASSLQVYELMPGEGGSPARFEPLMETGDSLTLVPRDWLDAVHDGNFRLSGDRDLLRYGQIVRSANAVYVCAYASALPAGFEDRLDAMRASRAQAAVIDALRPYLSYLGAWIFAMFCLPPAVMTVILAFFLSTRFVEPVRALQEAAERIASGDLSFRLVAHTRDELAETARIINSIADSGSVGGKADKKAVLRL